MTFRAHLYFYYYRLKSHALIQLSHELPDNKSVKIKIRSERFTSSSSCPKWPRKASERLQLQGSRWPKKREKTH